MDKIDNNVTQRLWPPNGVLEGIGVTRAEWDDMQASTLPRVLAIEVMFKKAARRLKDTTKTTPH